MLACARIGAPHVVVFGGFSSESLAERLASVDAKVLITQDEGWRKGGRVPLKANADGAVPGIPSLERVVVARRTGVRSPGTTSVTSGGTTSSKVVTKSSSRRGWERKTRCSSSTRPARRRSRRRRSTPQAATCSTSRSHTMDLRHPRRVGLVVLGRYRLGHRTLVHRLRSAQQRHHERAVRRGSRLPRLGPVLGDHRALRRDVLLHRPDADPIVREGGRRLSRRP